MAGLQTIVEERCDGIIENSIRHEYHVSLSHQDADGWRVHRANFLSGSRASGILRIKTRDLNEASLSEAPPVGATVGITFRLSHKKCMFRSIVRSVSAGDESLVVTVAWPEGLQQLQRRVFERATPPPGMIVAVRFWRTDGNVETTPESRDVRHGQLVDISAGGLRIKTTDLTDVEVGASYKCVFSPRHGAAALMLDAVLRHREATEGGRASLGFHFLGLDATADGMSTLNRLARIVGQYKRSHPQTGRIRRVLGTT